MSIIDKLPARLFWDIDHKKLDSEKHKRFIITRVMERGDIEDVQAIWNKYSHDKIREALTTARYLSPKTTAFFSNQFSLSEDAFRAHRRRQQNKETTWM
ncbi:MAG: hypothetical protein R6V56_09490 [Lentisphaeria bacterium]